MNRQTQVHCNVGDAHPCASARAGGARGSLLKCHESAVIMGCALLTAATPFGWLSTLTCPASPSLPFGVKQMLSSIPMLTMVSPSIAMPATSFLCGFVMRDVAPVAMFTRVTRPTRTAACNLVSTSRKGDCRTVLGLLGRAIYMVNSPR